MQSHTFTGLAYRDDAFKTIELRAAALHLDWVGNADCLFVSESTKPAATSAAAPSAEGGQPEAVDERRVSEDLTFLQVGKPGLIL